MFLILWKKKKTFVRAVCKQPFKMVIFVFLLYSIIFATELIFSYFYATR